jgi:hypothetical protein
MTTKKPTLKPVDLAENEIIQGRDLTEVISIGEYKVIQEDTGIGKPKKIKLEGHFGNVDIPTANGRSYPRSLWERELVKLAPVVESRSMYGELDHPSDGRTMLSRASHVITGLKIEGHQVIGTAEVLGTTAGKNLAALLEGGCKVGISSRGFGSTRPGPKGEDVVQDDYKLVTFDLVADPAAGAFPAVFIESKGNKIPARALTADQLKDINPSLYQEIRESVKTEQKAPLEESEDLKSRLLDQAREALRSEFSRSMAVHIAEAKADLREEVKAELMADPTVAGAAKALDNIKKAIAPFMTSGYVMEAAQSLKSGRLTLAESKNQKIMEDKLAQANKEIEDLTGTLRTVGYKYYLETLVNQYNDADAIRKLVGDVSKFDTSEELKAAVESVKQSLDTEKSKYEQATKKSEKIVESVQKEKQDNLSGELKEYQRREQLAMKRLMEMENELKSLSSEFHKAQSISEQANSSVQQVTEEKEKLSAKVDRAVQIIESYEQKIAASETETQKVKNESEALKLKLYAEQKLSRHPKAGKIREVLEASNPRSSRDIDQIVDKFREPEVDSDLLEDVRARTKMMLGRPGGRQSTPMEEETRVNSRPIPAIGITPNDFKKLAGIKD